MRKVTIQTTARPRPTTPLMAVEQLNKLADAYATLGIPPHVLNEAVAALQEIFEKLPVHFDGVKQGWIYGFVLVGSEWWPVHALIEIDHGACKGGIQYRIDYDDGNCESGIALPYKWAHCTAEDTVNYHWLDPVEVPEPELPLEPTVEEEQ